jgi:hypothetical protein
MAKLHHERCEGQCKIAIAVAVYYICSAACISPRMYP